MAPRSASATPRTRCALKAERLAGRLGLSTSRGKVIVTLAKYQDKYGQAYPSVAGLAKDTGLSERTVYRALADLEKRGLVAKEYPDDHRTTLYILTLDGVSQGVSGVTEPLTNLSANYSSSSYRATSKTSSRSNSDSLRSSGSSPDVRELPDIYTTEELEEALRIAKERESQQETSQSLEQPVSSTPASPVQTGWDAARRRLAMTKEVRMPTPGFEDEAPVARKRRWQPDDSDFGVVGRLEEEKPSQPRKAVSAWNAGDLQKYISSKARIAAPRAVDQVPVGWARKDFRRWLDAGLDPELLRYAIDKFFGDPGRLTSVGEGQSLWQRFRLFFVQNQADIDHNFRQHKGRQGISEPSGVFTHNIAYSRFEEAKRLLAQERAARGETRE